MRKTIHLAYRSFLHNLKCPFRWVKGGRGMKESLGSSLSCDFSTEESMESLPYPTGLAEILEVRLSTGGSFLVLACFGAGKRADRLNPV